VAISELTDVEMVSALYRQRPQSQASAIHTIYSGDKSLGVYRQIPVDSAVFTLAGDLAEQYAGQFGLRSLDALHLASAIKHGVNSFATFDKRLSRTAQAAGLKLVQVVP
jgi:predicted nucleic acid-binding protein